MLLTILIIFIVALLFLVAYVLVRAVLFSQHVLTAEPTELTEIDTGIVAQHLTEVIRLKTLGGYDPAKIDRAPFREFRSKILDFYPDIFKIGELIDLGTDCILLHIPGSEPDAAPVVLTGHFDVVPADPATVHQWDHEPFSGEIADGYIWGRGSLDDKGQVIAILEAFQGLLRQGFKPQRSIYLAFGNDEELTIGEGATRMAAWMLKQGIHPEVVLDEGGQIGVDVLPGVNVPVAMIGTAEKGYLTLELSVEGEQGHSAVPPRHTAIGILAAAITRLEANPLPAHPERLVPMMKALGGAAPFYFQVAFANLWLLRGLVTNILTGSPTTSATIRTTTAVTVIEGGMRENLLPATAKALVNFRILPDDTIASVCEHVRKTINDPRVAFKPAGDTTKEPGAFSPLDSKVYLQLGNTIQQVFGNMPVTPYLVLGTTDAHHYESVCRNVFRFTPYITSPDDLERVHGVNERLSIEMLGKMVQFYDRLIQTWTQLN